MSLRLAVLGCGTWGLNWCDVIGRVDGVDVAVTAGGKAPAGGNAPHYARHYEIPDNLELDAAIVSVPIHAHLEAVQYCVANEIPVLCEKPAVLAETELSKLRGVANDASTPINVVQNYRLRNWVQTAKREISSLGELSSVSIDVAREEVVAGGRDNLANPLLEDLAIHHLDLLRYLAQDEFHVVGASQHRPTWSLYQGSTDLCATLRSVSGILASYTGSWASRGVDTPFDGNWIIRGEFGTVEIHDLKVYRNGFEVPVDSEMEHEDLERVLDEFLSAVKGESGHVSVEDHAKSLQILFDIRQRLESGE